MNVSALTKNFNGLDIGVKVFLTLVLCARDNGEIELKKSDVAGYLDVSRQTVGKHIKSFAEANMLKYKFSGKGIFNPDFYYKGSLEEKVTAKELYERFKSDV